MLVRAKSKGGRERGSTEERAKKKNMAKRAIVDACEGKKKHKRGDHRRDRQENYKKKCRQVLITTEKV